MPRTGALYPDLADLRGGAYMNATLADPGYYVGNEFRVPIFVLTSEPPRGRAGAGRTADLHVRD